MCKSGYTASKSNNPFLISDLDKNSLGRWLARQRWLPDGAQVLAIEHAGEGNMNLIRRIRHTNGSLILKQSVPWVAKYPTIPAPPDRVLAEARFYELVALYTKVASKMPEFLGLDRTNRVLCLSDFTSGGDAFYLYRQQSLLSSDELAALATWLETLHGLDFPQAKRDELRNREMRLLNFQHIFQIPFASQNGIELDAMTPGLQPLADEIVQDTALVAKIEETGREHYLHDGTTLLHGDFFPGSILGRPPQFCIIDPEFCHFGCAEFDVGVFAAHLVMSHHPDTSLQTWLASFSRQPGFQKPLALRIAGIEILRRILGVAQLPLVADLHQKKQWIQRARCWIGM